jgi:hypothetical protein
MLTNCGHVSLNKVGIGACSKKPPSKLVIGLLRKIIPLLPMGREQSRWFLVAAEDSPNHFAQPTVPDRCTIAQIRYACKGETGHDWVILAVRHVPGSACLDPPPFRCLGNFVRSFPRFRLL